MAHRAPSAVASMSQSDSATSGDLPPSSSVRLAMFGAAALATFTPVGTDPVKVMCRTKRWEDNAAPASMPSPVTTFTTPGGTPQSKMIWARSSAVNGVVSAGLATTVQPAAKAGATLRANVEVGKFQGMMCAVTPAGSRTVQPMWFSPSGSERPSSVRAIAA